MAVVVLLALLGLVAAADGGAREVVVLTDANFASETATGVWFVEFYARQAASSFSCVSLC